MEVRFNIRQVVMWRIVLFSGIISLICACSYSGKKVCPPFDISFSGHTLLAIAPGFTIKATEDTLNKYDYVLAWLQYNNLIVEIIDEHNVPILEED